MSQSISTIDVVPDGRTLGARVVGADLATDDLDEVVPVIRQALLDYHVVVVPGQHELTGERYLEYAARWGEVFVHPYVPSIEGLPGVMKIGDTTGVTETWHQDSTHAARPPGVTMLLARRVPATGGDTLFANQHRAYETLSDGLRQLLDGLSAVHQGTELAAQAGLSAEQVHSVHPVVRHHPDTGRPALFVNANYTRRFEGWTEAESEPLLDFLYEHAGDLNHSWRQRWQVGDLLMWDNASVQHRVIADVEPGERELHRITIEGGVPA